MAWSEINMQLKFGYIILFRQYDSTIVFVQPYMVRSELLGGMVAFAWSLGSDWRRLIDNKQGKKESFFPEYL